MITNWLDTFIGWIASIVSFMDTFYIFSTISLLDFEITILIIGMLVNMFVARGTYD